MRDWGGRAWINAGWLNAGWLSAIVLALSVSALAGCDITQRFAPCGSIKPGPEDVRAAKGAHTAATRFYDLGHYQDAIDVWTFAYELDCTAHGLLINIGRALERLDRKQSAIKVFELYVERAGSEADPEIVKIVEAARAARDKGSGPPPGDDAPRPVPAHQPAQPEPAEPLPASSGKQVPTPYDPPTDPGKVR